MDDLQPVLVGGGWRDAASPAASFRAHNPATCEPVGTAFFPVSAAAEVNEAVAAATSVAQAMATAESEQIAAFLERYADGIEAEARALVALAHAETALPASPRLCDVELPRTSGQLRQAAQAVREQSWTRPVIDTKGGLRTAFGPLGKPVTVFGPNNFPLAFNAVAGSDFASAIAARNPVIAKAHPLHPGTSQVLARIAHAALIASGLPAAAIQMLYHIESGSRHLLVGQDAIGAVGFTGSRSGGLALKALADAAGVPFYAEMSSINPVFLLEGALAEHGPALAQEFFTSCIMGSGQFCTNPGLLLVPQGAAGDAFVAEASTRFASAPAQVLFSAEGKQHFNVALTELEAAGARKLAGGGDTPRSGHWVQPTLLLVEGDTFLADPVRLQTEAFGPASLIVHTRNSGQARAIASALEGSLTATLYRAADGSDDAELASLIPILRPRIGRLIVNKMPTGVAVSPAMHHGGPYPATSHPGFTAVGMPAAITRFTCLNCYDHIPESLLPPVLQDRNPGAVWRLIDGQWTISDIETLT